MIRNKQWILVNIHPHLNHIVEYMIKKPMTITLPNNKLQLIFKITNVEQLLYRYANVMQQINNSSCDSFTIAYSTNIAFGIEH